MLSPCLRLLALAAVFAAAAPAQTPTPVKALARNVEPGLEKAVRWKWQVLPSPGVIWGEGLPAAPVATPTPPPSFAPTPAAAPLGNTYSVQNGDRLILIAKRYGITVVQLKTFNNLTTDMIRIGQVLNIPTREQAEAIAPTPVPEAHKAPLPKGKTAAPPKDPLASQMDAIVLEVFLDREGFSAGPIDGILSLDLGKVTQLYLDSHPEVGDAQALQQKAQATVGDAFTQYTLKPEDFQFISPPKAQRTDPNAAATPPPSKKSKPKPERVSISFEDLISQPMLAYRTPWEFVAERFHCDEVFLRSINGQIRSVPQIGTVFRVPRVMPFEIENSLETPLQPPPDLQRPVVAVVEDLSLLEISQGGTLVAVMPISSARPGLRGRGTWTILNAIPRPQLATRREPTATATPPPSLFGASNPTPTPAPTPLPPPEYLASGPNNPAGIIWINLAKGGTTEALPYGLHGTSIPDQMKLLDSIGGFRVSNWNIARAVRLLPPGAPLEWKTAAPPVAKPAATVSPTQL